MLYASPAEQDAMTETDREDGPKPAPTEAFEVNGHGLTLLSEGAQRLAALITMIDGAQESLRLLYYSYQADRSGTLIRDALTSAQARGVQVSLIIDGFGSTDDHSFFRPLQDQGALVCRFIPRFGRRYLLRNHQKLIIADSARAIIGGFNIEDSYFEADGWRDIGLLIEGNAVDHLGGYFDCLARWTRNESGRMRDLRRTLHDWSQSEGALRWVISGPDRRLNPLALSIKREMGKTRHMRIIAAYFSPNPAMLRRIGTIALRGTARIITAAFSDNNTTIGAARHCYRRLLRSGVHIGEYLPSRLHSKMIILDDTVYLGSANFDMRSLYLNLELMLRIDDAAFADHMRGYFDLEDARCQRITAASHRARSTILKRVKWALAYFLVAVLDHRLTRSLNLDGD